MPEEKIPCDNIVRALKENLEINMEARRVIDDMSTWLVGRDFFEYERVFGKGPWGVTDIIMGLYREIDRGNIRAENGKLCRFDYCIDQSTFFDALYTYFITSYNIRGLIEKITDCEL
jgi:hypothetical protein